MNFSELRLYLIIVFAGLTLWFANEIYEHKKSETLLNDLKDISNPSQKPKILTFEEKLEQAMERQKVLQGNSTKNKADKYMADLRSKFTKEEFEEKLAVCNYFTDLYRNDRTKENELKYVKACDPMYH
jgi:hypothetical protein